MWGCLSGFEAGYWPQLLWVSMGTHLVWGFSGGSVDAVGSQGRVTRMLAAEVPQAVVIVLGGMIWIF